MFFPFQPYRPLPYLHSFPTRRSSDLALADFNHDGRVDVAVSQNGAATKLYLNQGAKRGLRVVLHGRSEEHTSELQSRGHLVCRLLLEKKNVRGRDVVRQPECGELCGC